LDSFPSFPRIASTYTVYYPSMHYVHIILINFILYLPKYICLHIPQLHQMEFTASQVRNYHSQKKQEARLQRALPLKQTANLNCWWYMWISYPAVKYCVVDDKYLCDNCDQVGRQRYSFRDQWWVKWSPWRIYLAFQYRRIWFGWRKTGHTSSTVVTRYDPTYLRDSSAKEMEPCQYCHCTYSISKFAISSWGHSTFFAQMPKVNHQERMRVWPHTHPGTPASQG